MKGVGGAGHSPWLTKDPIVTAAQIITNLQSIVSRQANLSEGVAVISVGQINAGNRINIIPEEATFSGTIRTLNEVTRTQVHEAVTRMAQKVSEASGLTADVKINRTTAVLYNNPDLTLRMLPALERAAGAGRVLEMPPGLAADDFAAFAAAAPGFYWFLNASPYADRAGAPNHSPLFAVDEQYLKTGVKALVNVVLHYMQTSGVGQPAR
ncbi:putative hydrolase YxeP [Luteitalea pratensis]|uniref:Putative hydrolase YxeP n=1 Tax=Luteitalea pratensis TaxID=1855912 RepID=A0A143PLZ8_LUTPR|nr:M20/M25/M40 family metallo-hydrolase [Luteitalea pratensis]AMY09456.1 putative hydrolase YxeP [Luteitalea pratensis]